MADKKITFAGLPLCTNLGKIEAEIVILGIPYGTPYNPDSALHSRNAPDAIRRESLRYPDDPTAWDFDLDRPLLQAGEPKIVDCGDLPGDLHNPTGNKASAKKAVKQILARGAVPVILGGDDSIPIPVLEAYQDEAPFTVLQVDAHIDWRDEVDGVRDGYSSTMRRASEMPWVQKIVQVGMRGVGSAREEEYLAARAFGAEIITSYQLEESGLEAVLSHIPSGVRCFLTIDFDALDPSEMPAVGGPTPGGLRYIDLVRLIHRVTKQVDLIGVALVELVPECDVHQLGAMTAMRVVWNVLGALIYTKKEC